MASRNLRCNEFQLSEELLPVDYHGLETKGELRAHVEQFRATKDEIAQGKRRRRNSTNDCRTRATIQAAGPDRRFDDIEIAESGMREGLSAIRFMPSYPMVQDFTRRSARWGDDIEQLSDSKEEELDNSSSLSSISDDSDIVPMARTRANASKQSTAASSKPTPIKTATDARRGSVTASNSKGSTTDSIFYKCYADKCKYQHARRSNFSIHWKRDAKHPGTFDLGKVLQCSQDQAGNITIAPYGNIKTHRQRLSFGTGHQVDVKDTSTSATISDVDASVPNPRKRKAPSSEPQISTRVASTTASVDDEEVTQQDSNSTTKNIPARLTQTSSAQVYSSLECQIFKRLADVPANFPAHLSPLITNGLPDTGSSDMTDCRFFCPGCDKCFTQTHNVASHFSRHHGKKYSKNDRARTICCRVTTSQNGVNIDAKPTDDTILPRLRQIRQDRVQNSSSRTNDATLASNTGPNVQNDDSASLKSESGAELASSFFNTGLTMHSGLARYPTASSAQGANQQWQSPRQPSQRTQRMRAVRESILAHVPTSPFSTPDGVNGQTLNSYTAAKSTEAFSTTNVNTRNEQQIPQSVGSFGAFRLTIPQTGSIATSTRQPEWEEINQPAPGLYGQKRKRSGDSDRSARDEEIECTDDEMGDILMGHGAELTQKENGGVDEDDDIVQYPVKRRKTTLFGHLGLEGYSSD